MKIGIYGGTFNPPHLGHLAAARAAVAALGLDKLLFVPAAVPPHKELPQDTPSPEHRLAMVEKMADAMVKEGEAKKQAAIDQAVSAAEARSQAVRGQLEQEEQKVRAQLEAVRQDLANEQARLEAARAATTAYIAQLKELYTKEIQYIGSLSNLTAPPVGGQGEEKAAPAQPSEDKPAGEAVVTVPPEQQEEVAQDIEASMAKIFEPDAEAPASSADLGDTRAFDQIQFGKDYEIE